MPSGSLAVLALNCFTKSMMLTPCGPSAVPTGGAGVALPAGSCNFTVACTFFAMRNPLSAACSLLLLLSDLFYLRKIQFDRGRAPQNRYQNLPPAALRIHAFAH